MSQENISKTEVLLEAFSEEITGLKKVLSEQATVIARMETVLVSIAEKTAKPTVVQPVIDMKPMVAAVQLGTQKIERIIDARPQTVTRKIQLLHYPPEFAKGIYNRVLGWSTLAIVAVLIILCTYRYYKYQVPMQLQIRRQELENDRIRSAWMQLYESANKKEKSRMDSAYHEKNLK